MLLTLLWPLVVEQALNVLVGMSDTVMVSSVGEAAISGVSLVDMINYLILNIFAALVRLSWRSACCCAGPCCGCSLAALRTMCSRQP